MIDQQPSSPRDKKKRGQLRKQSSLACACRFFHKLLLPNPSPVSLKVPPLTLCELLRIGAEVTQSMVQFVAEPRDREYYDATDPGR